MTKQLGLLRYEKKQMIDNFIYFYLFIYFVSTMLLLESGDLASLCDIFSYYSLLNKKDIIYHDHLNKKSINKFKCTWTDA